MGFVCALAMFVLLLVLRHALPLVVLLKEPGFFRCLVRDEDPAVPRIVEAFVRDL